MDEAAAHKLGRVQERKQFMYRYTYTKFLVGYAVITAQHSIISDCKLCSVREPIIAREIRVSRTNSERC